MIDKDIETKARKILQDQEDERNYLYLCSLASLCPKCGDKLRKPTEVGKTFFVHRI